MVARASSSHTLSADVQSLDSLKAQSARDPKNAIKDAARQFEALFMRQLVKSMRDASMRSGMLDNAGGDMARDLFDDQMATQLAGQPGGLSDLIARQLSRQVGTPADGPAAAATAPARSAGAAASTGGAASSAATPSAAQADFVRRHQASAQAAEAKSGIPASFILAQADHESGWGRHEIRNADGSPSFNLFGIKAGSSWDGKVAETGTHEYQNGSAVATRGRFRSYASYAEAFTDYAKFLASNPRYAQVLKSGGSAQGFAQGLQRAGYATDPAYAAKLTNAINATLRAQRVQA